MTAARHLRLVETAAEVIPMPRKTVEYNAQRHHILTTVASCAITRRGPAIAVDGKPARPGIATGLDDTTRAGLTVWTAQGDGDHVLLLTADGITALALWVGSTGGPRGGDAA